VAEPVRDPEAYTRELALFFEELDKPVLHYGFEVTRGQYEQDIKDHRERTKDRP
jgi:hypothetical protein